MSGKVQVCAVKGSVCFPRSISPALRNSESAPAEGAAPPPRSPRTRFPPRPAERTVMSGKVQVCAVKGSVCFPRSIDVKRRRYNEGSRPVLQKRRFPMFLTYMFQQLCIALFCYYLVVKTTSVSSAPKWTYCLPPSVISVGFLLNTNIRN